MLFNRLLMISCIAASVAWGQLYLLAGSPTQDNDLDSYASALFRVKDDGRLILVADLMPQHVGTFGVGVSYDWRKAVLLPKYEDNALSVLYFDKSALANRRDLTRSAARMRLQ